jgi:hypothetical protein
MRVTAVILAGTFNSELEQMTQKAIDLLHKYKGNNDLVIIVVESTLNITNYTHCTVIHNHQPKFNYNQAVQLGLSMDTDSDAYIICNNDIEPKKGYLDALIKSGYKSCSPLDPTLKLHDNAPEVWEGYRTSYQVCGWFIFFRSSVLSLGIENLFPLELGFWYQDNWYADQIRKAGIKHALISNSLVIHLESKTHDYLPEGMTHEQELIYKKLKDETTNT